MNEYRDIIDLAKDVKALADEDDKDVDQDVAELEAGARLLIDDRKSIQ